MDTSGSTYKQYLKIGISTDYNHSLYPSSGKKKRYAKSDQTYTPLALTHDNNNEQKETVISNACAAFEIRISASRRSIVGRRAGWTKQCEKKNNQPVRRRDKKVSIQIIVRLKLQGGPYPCRALFKK